MRASRFENSPHGALTTISGRHPRFGAWQHVAFVPDPLAHETPVLSTSTFNAVARARAALAGLDSSARQLPNPSLLRRPVLRKEAQSTSALEGTFAPLDAVLAADDDDQPADSDLREVMNFVHSAEHAFAWHSEGRPLTLDLLNELQARLLKGTAADGEQAGKVRTIQVMIGAHRGAHIYDARFVPRPPGPELEAQVQDWVNWAATDHADEIDPVVAAGMAHYQFETLHPYHDGNGRIGRLLIVLQLLYAGVLTEPTLTVSPWFEARRADYYDRLLEVSATGAWDPWLRFFADGLTSSAQDTARQLTDLLRVQSTLKERVRAAGLRADSAMLLVDFALSRPHFSVRQVERHLNITYTRANKLVGQLVAADVLCQTGDAAYDRRFCAPDVLAVLLRGR